MAATGCASSSTPRPEEPLGITVPPEHVVDFEFDSLSVQPVSSRATRGKPTVIAFVASDDLTSQAQVNFLATMAKNDGDKVNYAFVAVETPDRRELVEGFRHFFESKFGVALGAAMADKDTLAGKGAFGDVRTLTVFVLDRGGRIVWERAGLSKSDDIRAALRKL